MDNRSVIVACSVNGFGNTISEGSLYSCKGVGWIETSNFGVTHFPQVVVIGPSANEVVIPPVSANYNLLVEGGILTEHLRVANRTGNYWADYVFAPGYQLWPLAEVKRYITRFGHLPAMPSAATVEAEGIDVVETQRLHLQKIEELTLYIIRQQEEISRLQRQMRHHVRLKHR